MQLGAMAKDIDKNFVEGLKAIIAKGMPDAEKEGGTLKAPHGSILRECARPGGGPCWQYST